MLKSLVHNNNVKSVEANISSPKRYFPTWNGGTGGVIISSVALLQSVVVIKPDLLPACKARSFLVVPRKQYDLQYEINFAPHNPPPWPGSEYCFRESNLNKQASFPPKTAHLCRWAAFSHWDRRKIRGFKRSTDHQSASLCPAELYCLPRRKTLNHWPACAPSHPSHVCYFFLWLIIYITYLNKQCFKTESLKHLTGN